VDDEAGCSVVCSWKVDEGDEVLGAGLNCSVVEGRGCSVVGFCVELMDEVVG
jgi:hypothetical protein